MPLTDLSSQQHRKAAEILEKIEALKAELSKVLGKSAEGDTAEPASGKRQFSAATIAKMRRAQRARWSRTRAEAKAAGKGEENPKPKKRQLSAQGLANIRAGVEKRQANRAKEAALIQA